MTNQSGDQNNNLRESWWVIEGWADDTPGSVKVDGYVHSIHSSHELAIAATNRYADIVRRVLTDPTTGDVNFAATEP